MECKAEFLRRHDVSLTTFEYWKRRVRRAAPETQPVTFAPVRLLSTPEAGDGSPIVVVLATGERLIIPPGVSVDHVRTIVSALRTAC